MTGARRAAALAAVLAVSPYVAPSAALAQVTPDLVSRTALRVCSDPANLPFSNRQKQGFENKIADIVGDELKEPVRYLWAPSGPGFARNTINADLCDIVIGTTVGSEVVQSTNPYYRSTYVLVAAKDSDLGTVRSLADPRLKGRRLGVFAATPPVDVMLAGGLMDKAQVYPLLVDHRYDSPLRVMIGDLLAKKVDAAIVWGPLVGSDVKATNGALVMAPLLGDVERPGFSYRIAFGVRHDEPDWKHRLEAVIRKRRGDITRVLEDYGVPLLDDAGRIVTAAQASDAKIDSAPGGRPKGAGAAATPPGFKMPGPPPSDAQN